MGDDEKKMAQLREFDLSLCDEDISTAYREYGILNYAAERPLLAQLSRDIRALVSVLNLKIKVNATNDSKENSSDGNGAS